MSLHGNTNARGVGLFLEVKPDEYEVVPLIGCNFDARCVDLPQLWRIRPACRPGGSSEARPAQPGEPPARCG